MRMTRGATKYVTVTLTTGFNDMTRYEYITRWARRRTHDMVDDHLEVSYLDGWEGSRGAES